MAVAESSSSSLDKNIVYNHRLKAAIHYTVGRICRNKADENDVEVNKQFIAALTEAAFKQCKNFAIDLEAFAKHAKRSTISTEDVKLLVRKSPSLHTCIQDLEKNLQEEATTERNKRPVKSRPIKTKKKKVVQRIEEDSNSEEK